MEVFKGQDQRSDGHLDGAMTCLIRTRESQGPFKELGIEYN